MSKNKKATWSYSLDTECPLCKRELDLTDMDGLDIVHELMRDEGLELIEHDTDKSRNIEVVCLYCDHEFLVDLEY